MNGRRERRTVAEGERVEHANKEENGKEERKEKKGRKKREEGKVT